MRTMTAFFVSAACSLCACSSTPSKPTPEPGSLQMVIDGQGMFDLRFPNTTAADVRRLLGAPAQELTHGTYSIELVYPSGVHAYFCQNDSRQRIFTFVFHAPFPAVTARGIMRGRSTMMSAILAYGGPPEWTTTSEGSTWNVDYSDIGVGFGIEVDPAHPIDEDTREARPIDLIRVMLAPHYQCDSGDFPDGSDEEQDSE